LGFTVTLLALFIGYGKSPTIVIDIDRCRFAIVIPLVANMGFLIRETCPSGAVRPDDFVSALPDISGYVPL
jgi:hypothetical protein